jgi:SsrA-binding protein
MCHIVEGALQWKLGPGETMSDSDGFKIVADNRQARYLYEILETHEAGIALVGTEIKSIRAGKVNLRDGFALLRNGELFLLNVHVSPHSTASQVFNHEPRRTRKLLLHRKQIRKLIGQVDQQGLTLVPLKMYLKRGIVKVDLALVRGKKLHDKREDSRRKDDQRDMQRAMKNF